MSIAEPPPMSEVAIPTLADLLNDLGDISPGRVIVMPHPGQATEADLIRLGSLADKRVCELVDGTLVEKPMASRESMLAVWLGSVLLAWVDSRSLGVVTGEQGSLRLFPRNVRVPDVAFISWDRLPGRRIPDDPIWDLAPDLAVEILSPSNTAAEMDRKRHDYFRAGVRLVWEIDPAARTVAVYGTPDDPQVLREGDVLEGGTVLPGFRLPLPDLFGRLDRHG
jgi:Uma2 family endonuclease